MKNSIMNWKFAQIREAPWASNTRFRQNNFTLIRLVLALMVIVSHSYPASRYCLEYKGEPLYELTSGLLSLGSLAVNLFFILSGFLISHSLDKSNSFLHYICKRIARIYPAFIILMMLQAFLIAPLVSGNSIFDYKLRQLGVIFAESIGLVSYGWPYGGLFNVFPNNPISGEMNVSLWTIRYEFICYILLVLVSFLFQRPIFLLVLYCLILISFELNIRPPWHWILTGFFGPIEPWPRVLSCFFSGVIFYHFKNYIPFSYKLCIFLLSIVFVSAVFFQQLFNLVFPPCAAYVLLIVCYAFNTTDKKRLDFDISYGTYLYGFPIQQLIVFCVPPNDSNFFILLLLTLLLSMICGYLSWRFVEKPALDYVSDLYCGSSFSRST